MGHTAPPPDWSRCCRVPVPGRAEGGRGWCTTPRSCGAQPPEGQLAAPGLSPGARQQQCSASGLSVCGGGHARLPSFEESCLLGAVRIGSLGSRSVADRTEHGFLVTRLARDSVGFFGLSLSITVGRLSASSLQVLPLSISSLSPQDSNERMFSCTHYESCPFFCCCCCR